MRKQALGVLGSLTVLCLVLAGCSDSGSEAEAGPSPTTDAPVSASSEVGPNGPWVQDLWLYESARTLTDDGTPVELIGDVLAGLGAPTRSVDLPEGATFHVHDSLAPSITTRGASRSDVDVTAGVLEFEGSRALAALATPHPDAARPIGLDDVVELDVTHLDELLSPGDPMILDFAFLQARPTVDEERADGLDLLSLRLAEGRGHYLGDENGEPLAYRGALSEAVEGSTRMAAPGKGKISDPYLNSIPDGLKCRGLGIACVKRFFQKTGKGASTSNDLLRCNLGGSCGDSPRQPDVCIGLGCQKPRVRADPHLTSFDDLSFAMQGVGEYVLTRSSELEVQIRTEPIRPEHRSASATSMVAMKSGADHVVVAVEDSVLTLWVNDVPVTYTPADDYLVESEHGGLKVRWAGNDLDVTTPDGTVLAARRTPSNRWMDIGLTPGAAHTDLLGLLGDADSDPDNDWTARDGSVVSTSSTGRTPYSDFFDTWRVSGEESILRYAAGESTATFTDLTYPEVPIGVDDLDPAQRARAEAVCRAAGVDTSPLLEQCTLDYALSGDMGFVTSAQTATYDEQARESGSVADPAPGSGDPSGDSASETAWATTPSSAGTPEGTTFRHTCPPNGNTHVVWGGDNGVYTDDSSICTASVHAGLITVSDGGTVEVTRTPGLDDYGTGSTRNGVTTRSWERSWSGSFTLSR